MTSEINDDEMGLFIQGVVLAPYISLMLEETETGAARKSLMVDKGHSSAQSMHTDDILTAASPQAAFHMQRLHSSD
ncbi:Hypothetical predicted protein [Scomber scombrus]|uniref:Uncharacterized protein n=1 Tax=Scomber scombrus TaxID=13677 RepID=A0AAV1P2I2_SCOSC